MSLSNIIEVLSAYALGGFTTIWLVLGYLFKLIAEERSPYKTHSKFKDYESCWAFHFCWMGGMILCALFQIVIWVDIYQSIVDVDSTPFIFVIGFIYQAALFLWLVFHYVYRFPYSKTALLFALICGLVFGILVVLTLHQDHREWYHWLTFLLIVPPIFGYSAVHESNIFRNDIYTAN